MARHIHKVATHLTFEQMQELARKNASENGYFTASYENEFPSLCHITPAGKMVDCWAKPLRKKAMYDFYQYLDDPVSNCKG